MRICRRFKIQGVVQGVFFRANTQQLAQAYALTGWVRNTSDGGVECVACGEKPQLDLFEKWLHQGPDEAFVQSVTSQTIDFEEHKSFEILY